MAQVSIDGDGHLNRLINNFFQQKAGGDYDLNSLNALRAFMGYILDPKQAELKKKKVALLFICLNQPYWQYIAPAVQGARQFFLPGHQVDHFLWSDIPMTDTPEYLASLEKLLTQEQIMKEVEKGVVTEIQYPNVYLKPTVSPNQFLSRESVINGVNEVRNIKDLTIFPTEPIEWPYPTLWRFHLFSQQADKLKDYDYVFFCDADMKFVGVVGDEILGEGLTAAQHPMYAFKDGLHFPYESNPKSTAYIKRPGMFGLKNGQNFFQPFYYAGGFQGGKAKDFLAAAEKIKEMIDTDDRENHYIARWNDESYWNRYLADNPPTTILSPSYVYPDSMIETYYIPLWGRNYPPKLITLTKPFSLKQLTPEEMKANEQRGI